MKSKNQNYAFLLFISFSYWLIIGLSFSMFSVILQKNNVPEFLIGFSSSFRETCGILLMFFIPYLVNKFGLKKISAVSVLLYTSSMLLLPFYVNYSVWLLLTIVFSCGMMAFGTFIDSLLNVMSKDNKGKMNGLMNTIVLLSFSLPPLLINYILEDKYSLFLFIGVLNIMNLLFFSKLETEYKEVKFVKELNLIKYFKEMPVVVLSKILFEFASNMLFIFTVIYAHNNGYTYEIGGLFLTIYCISGLLTSYLVGYIFNKSKNKKLLLIAGSLATILLIAIIPIFVKSLFIISAIYIAMGLSTNFMYLGCLIILNENYKDEELVSVNSTLAILDSGSTIVVGIVGGLTMQYYNSMTHSICWLGLVYILSLLILKNIKSVKVI
jgi:MFS family permease